MVRKNNKGFTMIEILGAIIIMGILLLIAVPTVSKLMKGFRDDYYVELEETIETSAKDFYSDNRIYRPDGLLKSSYTSIDSLIRNKYVDKLVDYKGKNCSLKEDESYVVVIYKGNNKYEYKACIKCGEDDYISDSDKTYCDPAWRNNNNIKYNFGNRDELFVYHNTSKEDVRKKLLNNVNIVKYNKNGETLDSVVLEEGSKENILPFDIDNLDTTISLNADNKYETTLHYVLEGVTKELNVVVYKHKSPIVNLKHSNGNNYNGNWTNKVIVELQKNDNYFELSNTTIGNYQYSYNGGSWKNITCEMTSSNSCSYAIDESVNGTYKFRIVSSEGKISDESSEYIIKVDSIKPTVSISPNGGNPIVAVGSNIANVTFELNTSDNGGSEIKSRKYAINKNSNNIPESFTNFYTNIFNVDKNLEGSKYYVWAIVEDNAGNTSVNVWPSNVFQMKYEVKYNANSGSGAPSTSYKKHGEDLTLSSTVPTRTGYSFNGWATSSDGNVVYNKGGKYTDNKSILLYANWTANKYKLLYDENGGSACTDKEVTYNQKIETLCSSTKTGYTLDGWYYSNDTKASKDDVYKTTSDTTIKANWTANTYKLKYDENGGSACTDKDVTYNQKIGTLCSPTKDGYTFKGWYYSDDTKASKDDVYKTAGDKTIKAKWTASYPNVTVGSEFMVCPSDNSSKSREQCLREEYNRLEASNIKYDSSTGKLSFKWKMTMNKTSATWSGTCPKRVMCVAKMDSDTCKGKSDFKYEFNVNSGWLGTAESTSGTGFVKITNSWDKGEYRLIVKHVECSDANDSHGDKFSFNDRNKQVLFEIK